MPPLVHAKFRALQRTKPLLYPQKLQENKNQTNKANLQIHLGVLKQACDTQLHVGIRSIGAFPYGGMGREKASQLKEPRSTRKAGLIITARV